MSSSEKIEQDIDVHVENEYMGSHWVKNIPQHIVVDTYIKEWTEISCKARESFDVELDICYGRKKECKLDIYRGKQTPQNASVLIFIHGGYWQQCSKDEHAMVVFPAMMAGSTAVVVGHQLAPEASLDEIVNQIKTAIEFVAKRFPKPSLYLSGHSAGAQLVAMMMTQQSWDDPNLPTRVQGICIVSGIFDVVPLLKTSVNTAMKMKREDAERNSPALLLKQVSPSTKCPVIVVVGEDESPSFHNQSKDFSEILKSHGIDSRFLKLPMTDHFSIMSKLYSTDFQLSQELYNMLKGKY